jgi:hypothetical protein
MDSGLENMHLDAVPGWANASCLKINLDAVHCCADTENKPDAVHCCANAPYFLPDPPPSCWASGRNGGTGEALQKLAGSRNNLRRFRAALF